MMSTVNHHRKVLLPIFYLGSSSKYINISLYRALGWVQLEYPTQDRLAALVTMEVAMIVMPLSK
ncbi:MAG TPA: hypothetical protein VH500_21125 [Nitrososphaeraceae archaeon]|jgi:hypothetical protein